MVRLGNFLTGLERGVQVGLPLGQRAVALQQEQRRQQQAQFSQGLQTLANLHRVPKPFRSRVIQEINERSFGGAFDEDTVKRFAQLNEQDSQMLGELMQQALPGFTPQQFSAVARQMGGVTDAFRFLSKFADRREQQQAQQQQREDLVALGSIGRPSAPPPAAPSTGIAAAEMPQQTESLTMPVPSRRAVQPNVQAQIQRLQQQLIFLAQDPRGQRLAAERPELVQNMRTALQSLTQQQQAQRPSGPVRDVLLSRGITEPQPQDIMAARRQVEEDKATLAREQGRARAVASAERLSPAASKQMSGLVPLLANLRVLETFDKDLERWVGPVQGRRARLTQLAQNDARYQAFLSTMAKVRNSIIFSRTEGGGGALTPTELGALTETVPSDQALGGAARFRANLRNAVRDIRTKIQGISRFEGAPVRDVNTRVQGIIDQTLQEHQSTVPPRRRTQQRRKTLLPETQRRITDRFNK